MQVLIPLTANCFPSLKNGPFVFRRLYFSILQSGGFTARRVCLEKFRELKQDETQTKRKISTLKNQKP